MLTLERCKKILGNKANELSDEKIEAMRDELYIAANLAFAHWQKNCSSTKAGEPSPIFVGEQPTSSKLPAGESADEKIAGGTQAR
jgi:hypothetical protein